MWNCKRCGQCCHFEREWVDGKIVNFDPCPFLSFDGSGLASCEIYDERPFVCEYYFCERQPLTPDKQWDSKGLKTELKQRELI